MWYLGVLRHADSIFKGRQAIRQLLPLQIQDGRHISYEIAIFGINCYNHLNVTKNDKLWASHGKFMIYYHL